MVNISNGNSCNEVFNPSILALNNWHHLTATWDGSALALYVNGSIQANIPTTVAMYYPYTQTNVCVGCRSGYDVGECVTGKLDEVAIWNRALSSNEVSSLYVSGLAPFYPTAAPTTKSSLATQSTANMQSSATSQSNTVGATSANQAASNAADSPSSGSKKEDVAAAPIETKSSKTTAIAAGIAGGVVGFALSLLVIFIVMRRRAKPEPYRDVESVYGELPSPGTNANITVIPELRDRVIPLNEVRILDKPIGQGASGIVFKGIRRNVNVAVKRLKTEDATMLQEECKLMKRITPHRNVVQFLGIIESPLSLITEYCSIGALDEYLYRTEGSITMAKRTEFLIDIAKGMAHLHSHRIIHRDLAARNCLLSEGFVVKVSDFGMSRILEGESLHSVETSAPLKWMAPETLSTNFYSFATDVYSFGVLGIEVLTGAKPYPDLTFEEFRTRVLPDELTKQLPYCIPQDTPASIRDVIIRCLSQDPSHRPTFTQVVAQLRS